MIHELEFEKYKKKLILPNQYFVLDLQMQDGHICVNSNFLWYSYDHLLEAR